jgi:D-alanine-D-alanine ligase
MRITVLTGGATVERTVAFAGATQVVAALRGRGHVVAVVDLATGVLTEDVEKRLLRTEVGMTLPDVANLIDGERRMLSGGLAALEVVRTADVLFLVVHGGAGEGGILQAVLEVIGTPYTGSGPLGSALAVDKDLSKRLFRAAGVPVAEWCMAVPDFDSAVVDRDIGWPAIVKPSKQGSTVGLTLVKRQADLGRAIAEASRWDDEVMIERFIPGRELTVGVLGSEALPPGEIVPKHELFDYECKYTPGMSQETFPADLDPALARNLQQLAVQAHRALKLSGYSRIDFRVTAGGDIFCLEANNLPGLTRTSLYPQAARAAGIDYAEMCERICSLARNIGDERRE